MLATCTKHKKHDLILKPLQKWSIQNNHKYSAKIFFLTALSLFYSLLLNKVVKSTSQDWSRSSSSTFSSELLPSREFTSSHLHFCSETILLCNFPRLLLCIQKYITWAVFSFHLSGGSGLNTSSRSIKRIVRMAATGGESARYVIVLTCEATMQMKTQRRLKGLSPALEEKQRPSQRRCHSWTADRGFVFQYCPEIAFVEVLPASCSSSNFKNNRRLQHSGESLLCNKAGHFSTKRGLFVFRQPPLIPYHYSRDHYLEINTFLKRKNKKAACGYLAGVTHVANAGNCFTPG